MSVREDAQAPRECRLDHALCAGIIAREMIGTPVLMRAYLAQRCGSATDLWQISYVESPDISAGKVHDLVLLNFAHEGTHFLVVTLEVATTRRDRSTAECQENTPVWVQESIEHVMVDELDRTRVARRAGSYLEAQNSRRTGPVATHPERPLEITEAAFPDLRVRSRVEYAGWAGPFELDGTPVNVGLIELQPCTGSAIDKMPIERP